MEKSKDAEIAFLREHITTLRERLANGISDQVISYCRAHHRQLCLVCNIYSRRAPMDNDQRAKRDAFQEVETFIAGHGRNADVRSFVEKKICELDESRQVHPPRVGGGSPVNMPATADLSKMHGPVHCGKDAGMLYPGTNYACILPLGHPGDCRPGGTCFKHGDYIGTHCPHFPDCGMRDM